MCTHNQHVNVHCETLLFIEMLFLYNKSCNSSNRDENFTNKGRQRDQSIVITKSLITSHYRVTILIIQIYTVVSASLRPWLFSVLGEFHLFKVSILRKIVDINALTITRSTTSWLYKCLF